MESPRAMILTVDWRSASSAGAALTTANTGSAANAAFPKLNRILVILLLAEMLVVTE